LIFDGREEGVVGRDWAARSYRANLIDMHIPDWDPVFLSRFDSVRYVELLRKAKVETAYKIANWRSSCGPLVATVSAVSTPPTRGYSTQMPPNRLRSRCFTSIGAFASDRDFIPREGYMAEDLRGTKLTDDVSQNIRMIRSQKSRAGGEPNTGEIKQR
jgi:hypothetical protein